MAKLKIRNDRKDPGKIRRIEADNCQRLTVRYLNGRRAVLEIDGQEFLMRATNPKACGLIMFEESEEQVTVIDQIVMEGGKNLTIRRMGPGCYGIEYSDGGGLEEDAYGYHENDFLYSIGQGCRKAHEGIMTLEPRTVRERRR